MRNGGRYSRPHNVAETLISWAFPAGRGAAWQRFWTGLVTRTGAARGSAGGTLRSARQELADHAAEAAWKARPGIEKKPPVERREAGVPIARDARRLASAWRADRKARSGCLTGTRAPPGAPLPSVRGSRWKTASPAPQTTGAAKHGQDSSISPGSNLDSDIGIIRFRYWLTLSQRRIRCPDMQDTSREAFLPARFAWPEA
jgi:hypothetical protein